MAKFKIDTPIGEVEYSGRFRHFMAVERYEPTKAGLTTMVLQRSNDARTIRRAAADCGIRPIVIVDTVTREVRTLT